MVILIGCEVALSARSSERVTLSESELSEHIVVLSLTFLSIYSIMQLKFSVKYVITFMENYGKLRARVI